MDILQLIVYFLYGFCLFMFRSFWIISLSFKAIDYWDALDRHDMDKGNYRKFWYGLYEKDKPKPFNFKFIINVFDLRKWTVRHFYPSLYNEPMPEDFKQE